MKYLQMPSNPQLFKNVVIFERSM